jgi:hypothetical protein
MLRRNVALGLSLLTALLVLVSHGYIEGIALAIAEQLGLPSPDVIATRVVGNLVFAIALLIVLAGVFIWGRISERRNPTQAETHVPVRDVTLHEAVWRAFLGRWQTPNVESSDVGMGEEAAQRLHDTLQTARQYASDGTLPVWGKTPPDNLFRLIPIPFWARNRFAWIWFVKGTPEEMRTEKIAPASIAARDDAEWIHLMTDRKIVERLWPTKRRPFSEFIAGWPPGWQWLASSAVVVLLLVGGGTWYVVSLSQQVAQLTARRWRALGLDEIQRLSVKLATVPPAYAAIYCRDDNCLDLADSLKLAFEEGHWKVDLIRSYMDADQTREGINISPDSADARVLAEFISDVTQGRLAATLKPNPNLKGEFDIMIGDFTER